MAKKKKKPNIASIMADHDKMFRSLAPGAFGKVPPVFKQSEKEMQRAKKPKRQKRRDQKRAASAQPETSVIDVLSSGIDVLSSGVVDAISGATFGLETTFGGYFQQGGMATSQVDRQDSAKGEETKQDATPNPSTGVKAQASGDGNKPQSDSKPAQVADGSLKDAGGDLELQEFDIDPASEESGVSGDYLQQSGVDDLIGQADVSGEIQGVVSQSLQQDADSVSRSVEASIGQGVTEQIASLENDRGQKVSKEAGALSKKSDDASDNLVSRRRAKARRESEAAARNFRRRRGENVPPPPIAGIPNPIPNNNDFDLGILPGEEKGQGVSPDEKRVAENTSASGTLEFAKSTTELMEKMGTEMQALAVRIRNIENMIDRL